MSFFCIQISPSIAPKIYTQCPYINYIYWQFCNCMDVSNKWGKLILKMIKRLQFCKSSFWPLQWPKSWLRPGSSSTIWEKFILNRNCMEINSRLPIINLKLNEFLNVVDVRLMFNADFQTYFSYNLHVQCNSSSGIDHFTLFK